MKYRIAIFVLALTAISLAHAQVDNELSQESANKQLALNFYQDLWATNNTDRYLDYVAETYIAHDIGDRKNVVEPAIEQKIVADRLWSNGSLSFELDYQIAEGDLVATRWIAHYEPNTLMGKLMFGSTPLPIINVFRIEDGKIVELWNHRHDIDTNITNIYIAIGLLIGLLIALIPTIIAFRLRGRLKKLGKA